MILWKLPVQRRAPVLWEQPLFYLLHSRRLLSMYQLPESLQAAGGGTKASFTPPRHQPPPPSLIDQAEETSDPC